MLDRNSLKSFRPRARGGLHGLAFALLCLALSKTALAHGLEILLETDPPNGSVVAQAPSRVVLRFKTELETRSSRLEVFDEQGLQVDLGDGGVDLNDPGHASLAVSLPSLVEGTYIVQWRAVVFEDGDVVESLSSFTVSASGSGVIDQTLTSAELSEAELPDHDPTTPPRNDSGAVRLPPATKLSEIGSSNTRVLEAGRYRASFIVSVDEWAELDLVTFHLLL